MMITISKTFESFRRDINDDNSVAIALFGRITSGLFKVVCAIGVPLLICMLLFL